MKKNYTESQSRRTTQLGRLSDELHGVHRIMFENIDAALQRGELISGELFDKIHPRNHTFPSSHKGIPISI